MLFSAYLCMRFAVINIRGGLVCRNVIYVMFCVLVVFGNGFIIIFILIT
jgi:hypothetical protein